MTRAILARSASTPASRSIIEAMIRISYGVPSDGRRAVDDVLLLADPLHQRDHPLDDLTLALGVRHLVRVGEQQPLERRDTSGGWNDERIDGSLRGGHEIGGRQAVDGRRRAARPSWRP